MGPSDANSPAEAGAQADMFWQWSVDVYASPGVAPPLLSLQDEEGLDVNLLLLCLWAATRGRALDRAAIDRISQAVAPWAERALQPLRRLRRDLKQPVCGVAPPLREEVRATIAAAELAAERAAQAVIIAAADLPSHPAAVPSPAEQRALAAASLEAYAGRPLPDLVEMVAAGSLIPEARTIPPATG